MELSGHGKSRVTASSLAFLAIVMFASTTLVWTATLGMLLVDEPGRSFLILSMVGLALFLGVAAICSLVWFLATGLRATLLAVSSLVCVITVLILVLVPFYRITTDVYFRVLKPEREAIVTRVLSGEIESRATKAGYDDGWVALGPGEPLVSRGGNNIIVDSIDGKAYIFFYTDRGIFGEYSGFLWVSDGGNPTRFEDLRDPSGSQVRQYDEHWYWVSGG
jgi:hypothetical protein